MKRIIWLTDVHLNFVRPHEVDRFLDHLLAADPDAVLISGDIGESHDVGRYLAQIDDHLQRPVYFVLGNHDFYRGSIPDVRRRAADLCRQRPRLTYLTHSEPVELDESVGLVGHDGWADGRAGDYAGSEVMLTDYALIAELSGITKEARWPVLKALGDEAAAFVRRVLPEALATYSRVFFVSHVPPLRQACWHEGRISDDQWAPHFTCQAMGDAILEIMGHHPRRQLTVLCGHTHGAGETRPLDNVLILTGGAEYGRPEIARVFDIP